MRSSIPVRFWCLSLCIVFSACQSGGHKNIPWPDGLPVYDHIVIVMEENKDYDEVMLSGEAPYIETVLGAEGARLTKMFAEEHNSEGNYFWLFSGSNQNVGFIDEIPDSVNNSDYPFRGKNLGQQLIEKGLSFKGYSEGLPWTGSTVDAESLYARKHVPWVSFGNLPNGSTAETSVNLPFSLFPSDYTKLPTVAIVVPDLTNDMHDGGFPDDVRAGDKWLREKLDGYYQWAKSHNSLLIVTFDESEKHANDFGLTDPGNPREDLRNRIPTILAGAHIKPGDYDTPVTHVNLLHTIEAMYGLELIGNQQLYAEKRGITGDRILVEVFEHAEVPGPKVQVPN